MHMQIIQNLCQTTFYPATQKQKRDYTLNSAVSFAEETPSLGNLKEERGGKILARKGRRSGRKGLRGESLTGKGGKDLRKEKGEALRGGGERP